MSELATKYNPSEVEDKWYAYWMEHGLFHSEPDEREPFCIVIPPPNVTGVLHMGHMLNNTIQDILVRRARMQGKNALWVPGTDHAAISTEAKVVAKLAQEGIKKTDLSREEFLNHAWDWTNKYGGIILQQLRKLGASCDWGPNRLHYGRNTLKERDARLLRPLQPRPYLSRRENGELGSESPDSAFRRGGDLQRGAKPSFPSPLHGGRGRGKYIVVATTRPRQFSATRPYASIPTTNATHGLKGSASSCLS